MESAGYLSSVNTGCDILSQRMALTASALEEETAPRAQRAGRLESFLCSVRRCMPRLRAVAETLPPFSANTR